MFESIAAGLIIAALTGLAWLAYTHPSSFERFAIGLMGLAGAVAAMALGYAAGYKTGIDGVVAAAKNAGTTLLVHSNPPALVWWVIVIAGVFIVYLMALSQLHNLLGRD